MSTTIFLVAFAPDLWYARLVTAKQLVQALTKPKMRELLLGPFAHEEFKRGDACLCVVAGAFYYLEPIGRWQVRGRAVGDGTYARALFGPRYYQENGLPLKPWQARFVDAFDDLAIPTRVGDEGHGEYRDHRVSFTGREVYDLLAEKYM